MSQIGSNGTGDHILKFPTLFNCFYAFRLRDESGNGDSVLSSWFDVGVGVSTFLPENTTLISFREALPTRDSSVDSTSSLFRDNLVVQLWTHYQQICVLVLVDLGDDTVPSDPLDRLDVRLFAQLDRWALKLVAHR